MFSLSLDLNLDISAGMFFISIPIFLFTAYKIGQFLFPEDTVVYNILFGALRILGVMIIFLSLYYWFFDFNQYVSVGFSILIFFISLLFPSKKKLSTELNIYWHTVQQEIKQIWQRTRLIYVAFLGVTGSLYGLLFFVLSSKRFGDTLVSPWLIFGPRFFLVFFIATALLLYLFEYKSYPVFQRVLLFLHYTLLYSILLIVYKHGFGFDAFIHQAAEQRIWETGLIEPKTPYYIGQYMLVLWLHQFTHIPIALIDQALVPLGAIFFFALFIPYFLDKIGLAQYQHQHTLLLSFLPLSFFTFTTPNNVSLLIALFVSFWIYLSWKKKQLQSSGFAIFASLVALCIHPFIGVMLCGISLATLIYPWLNKRSKQLGYLFLSVYTVGVAFITPLLFFIHSYLNNATLSIVNPLMRLNHFVDIFRTPYWIWYDGAPLFWEALYRYKGMIIPACIILMGLSAYILYRKNKTKITFYVCTLFGVLCSSFLLATTINFKDVIFYEQGVYAKRFLEFALVFALPFLLFGIFFLMKHSRYRAWTKRVSPFLGAVLLLISFYFFYPTRDAVSHYTGYNLRDADLEAISFIHERNEGNPEYIVLSNQVIATGALKQYGFLQYHDTPKGEQYFYSIPTGGPLYEYFWQMVYQGQRRETMDAAMDFAGVDTAYFFHTNYWAPAESIRDQAILSADEWWELGNGRVWVFEYQKTKTHP